MTIHLGRMRQTKICGSYKKISDVERTTLEFNEVNLDGADIDTDSEERNDRERFACFSPSYFYDGYN